jgi:hypothetical protein
MAKEDLRDTGERLGTSTVPDVLKEGGVSLLPASERVAPEWGARERRREAERRGNFLSNVIGLDSPIAGIHRMWEDSGYEYDPSFSIADLTDEEWKFYSQGIDEDRLMGLASAGSKAHLAALAVRLRAQTQAEQELAAYGGWGIAGRIGVNLLDPVSLAVTFGTAGIGSLAKGERLVRAVRAARAAGKLDEARTAALGLEAVAKTSPWRNAALVGGAAAVENMGIEALAGYGDPTHDGWDMAAAGLFGLVLGAGTTRLFNGREITQLRGAYLRERHALDLAELEARIASQRDALTAKLAALERDGDVDAARGALAALERDLAEAANLRRQALTAAAADTPKRSELSALDREVRRLRREQARVDGLEPEIEARMLQEDIAAVGEREALSRPRAKLRRDAAKLEARKQQLAAKERLTRAEGALERGRKATEARDQLRRFERAEKQGKPLMDLLDGPTAQQFAARQAAAQGALAKALGIQAERKAAVQAKIDGLEEVRKAGVKSAEAALTRAASGFGRDTLSSARFGGFNEGLHPHLAGDEGSGLPEIAKMALAGAVRHGPVATISGILRGSDNALVRKLLGRMVGNSIGNADGSANVVGASEIAKRLSESLTAKFNTAVAPAYEDWAKRNGYGLFGRQLRKTREAFMAELGLHIRGQESADPAIAKAAAGVRAVFKDYLTEAKAAGVKGFENVDPNANYLPRVFDFRRVHDIEQQIGSENLRELVKGAILAANEDLDEDLAARLAKAYVNRMKELRVGSDLGLMQGMNWDDLGFLRRFLEEAGTDPKEIEEIVGKFAAIKQPGGSSTRSATNALLRERERLLKKQAMFRERIRTRAALGKKSPKAEARMSEIGERLERIKDELKQASEQAAQDAADNPKGEGSFRNAKRRVQFDENFAMTFRDQNAYQAGRIEEVTIRMSDLFENNVEALYGRYSRAMSGHIGLAKVGIKSRKDFDDSIKLVERELNDDLRELKRVKETAEVTYKIITGQPIEDATTLTRLGRAARDYNFSTTMGQAGFAQVPDFHGLLVRGYLGYTLKNFFGALKTFRRVDGSIDDDFYREMEEMIGVGTDYHNNAVFSSYDPGEESLAGLPTSSKIGALADNALGRVEHGLRVSSRGVQAASGMAFMNSFAQRLAARAVVQRIVKDVLKGGAFSPRRAAALGLDDAMKARIAKQIKAHTEFVEGDFGGKVRIVNWAKWDDIEARDAMMNAAFRESRRIVQEEDLGDTSLWMHKNWGKILVQFRRFAFVSYSKQLLFGIAHHDAEAATALMLSMTLAAMAYKARHEAKVAALEVGGADNDTIEKYREKYLTLDRYAAAAWANSSYSSLTPALIDSTSSFATGERFFDTRNSGLGSDIITGNPTYSLVKNLGKAGSGAMQAALRGDRQFDKSDAAAFRRLLPYQNVLGMDAMFQAITGDLPAKDDDTDPNAIDWLTKD